MVSVAASAIALAGCGGATEGTGGPTTGAGTGGGGDTSTGDTTVTTPPSTNPPDTGNQTPGVVGATCAQPTPVQVASGGVIWRRDGSALRLQLVYQGSSIGVTSVRGVDMILPPSDGPFTAGAVSGYWFETRKGNATTYQHLFQDPTNQEAFPGPGGGGFGNSTIDKCAPKSISVDIPNDPGATELVIFGSPYGTNDAAVELARFNITISTK